MKTLVSLFLALLLLPAIASESKTARSPSTLYIFMDIHSGVVPIAFRLKVQGVEIPPMQSYRYVELSLPAGQYQVESESAGVGGTSLTLEVGSGERHYVFINPVGLPRPKPVLTVVDAKRGVEGVGKSSHTPIMLFERSPSLALLAAKGIRLARQPAPAPTVLAQAPAAAPAPEAAQAVQAAQAAQAAEEARRKQTEIDLLRAQVEDARKRQAEVERLRAESEEAKRKLAATEENLKRISQQQAPQAAAPAPAPVPAPLQVTSLGNRRALIIGNDTYQSVPKLANAREDARTIAASLSAVGYQVTLRLDLNEREMNAALRAFSSQVQGGDEVLFFFAGHGVQLGAANYLLPTDIGSDSEAQVRDEAIQLQRILDDFSDRKAKFTLAMLDACRDNPFRSVGRSIGGRGLAPTTAATGQMVIFSAGTGQQAMDKLHQADTNKNGLFTRIFVQEMQRPGVSIDRVMKNVRNQVAELAKSVGHEQVPAIYDQVLGDFFFKQ